MQIERQKDKGIWNRIIFSLTGCIIAFVISIAILCPPCSKREYEPNGNVAFALTQKDIIAKNNCDISPEGKVSVTDGDSYIVLKTPETTARCVKIIFAENVKENSMIQLFFAKNGEFSELNSCKSGLFHNDTALVFSLPELNYNSIRIDSECDYVLGSIEFYEDVPTEKFSPIKISIGRYFAACIITLVTSVILFVIDIRTNIATHIALFQTRHHKRLLQFVLGIICACLAGIGIELLISHCFIGINSVGQYFTFSRCAYITAVLAIVYCFFFFRKDIGQKPERLFLCLTLILGSLMIVTSPFGHKSWDLDSHFKWAVNASYYKESYASIADIKIYCADPESGIKSSLPETQAAITAFDDYGRGIIATQENETTIAHRLSGAFIAISRLFGAGFYVQFLCGEFANLLIYAVVSFFAIRKLNSGKMILTVIALFPTSLFLATNYSYDYWVTCFSFLGMAYFISEMQQQEKPITFKDSLIMCGAFSVACLPKLLYAPLMLIPFFMRKKCFSKKEHRKYLGLCAAVLLLLFALLLLKSWATIASGGDMRGGAEISTDGQIEYIFAVPFTYMKTLLKFLRQYLSFGNMSSYIVNFAYLGMGVCPGVFVFLMFFTAVTDKNSYDQFAGNGFLRIAALVFYLGMAALMATALYIAFTPVGADTISGCQARYLIPVLFPLMSLIGNPGSICRVCNYKKYNLTIMAIATVTILYNIYRVMILKMI